jgi:hypothetical protein
MGNMNDRREKDAAAAMAWFRHSVPLWTLGVAFLIGAVASHL